MYNIGVDIGKLSGVALTRQRGKRIEILHLSTIDVRAGDPALPGLWGLYTDGVRDALYTALELSEGCSDGPIQLNIESVRFADGVDWAHLWGGMRAVWLHAVLGLGVTVKYWTPTHLKKVATTKGGATKDGMVLRATLDVRYASPLVRDRFTTADKPRREAMADAYAAALCGHESTRNETSSLDALASSG